MLIDYFAMFSFQFKIGEEKIYTFIAGSYETDLENIGGEWKITHRIVHVDNGASFVEGDIAEQTQPFMEWMATNSEVMQGE